ncbi:MAG TPA: AIM24 family protein, partial [Vicinamibacteria bacterium]|nr:AIM24 family protein [Vicinamibacteria bacterium]
MSGSAQWYTAVGGHQVGPVTEGEILANIRNGSLDGETLVFTAGMEAWAPLKDVARFQAELGPRLAPAAVPALPGRRAHEIDFKIVGEDVQFIEVELDPGESVVAEAGVMMYMTQGIEMETIFGDGSQAQSGIVGALLGAGKRLLTGESLFMTVFTARGGRRERVAFAAPYPGRIIPVDLARAGGELICQKDSFLCAAKGVSIGIA